MGCVATKKNETEHEQNTEKVKASDDVKYGIKTTNEFFNDFLETMCTVGPNEYVAWQKLECAFANYLKTKFGKSNSLCIEIASNTLDALCLNHGFEKTPGLYIGHINIIRTEYVLGLSVIRFRIGVVE